MDTSEDRMGDSTNDGDAETDVLTWLLGKLLDSYVNQAHPNVRQVCLSFLPVCKIVLTILFNLAIWCEKQVKIRIKILNIK